MKIFQICLWQTNAKLIEGKKVCFLFDPTFYPYELAQIKGALPDKPLNVIYTHADWDHIAGFSEFSDGHTIGHHKIKERKDPMEKVRAFDLQWYVARNKELGELRINEEITEETVQSILDDTLLFLPIPGHTDDMMATFFLERKLVVAGDILSDLVFPFIFYSGAKYIESSEKMKEKVIELGIHRLVPGHRRVIVDSQVEILQRIEGDLEYLQGLMSGRGDALYRGKPIPEHLIARHEANVEFVEKELN